MFHQSLQKAKSILEKNQYPKSFIDPIIKSTIEKLVRGEGEPIAKDQKTDEEKEMFIMQYRGKISDELKRNLHKLNAPCRVVFTLKKLKNVLPSLKPVIKTPFKSWLVYKINCPRCNSCYVGYTCRHLISRFKEHKQPAKPVSIHMRTCNRDLCIDVISIFSDFELVDKIDMSSIHKSRLHVLI